MLYEDLIDLQMEVLGGYVCAIPPQDLPPGASPNCRDVAFPQAAVKTRGGLLSVYSNAVLPANVSINGLKTYLTPTLAQRLMIFDSAGSFYKENPQGAVAAVAARPQSAGLLYHSVTMFGREYQAFYGATGGADIPRQFDDTNWDRVSHDGPGAAPAAVDSVTAGNISAGAHQVSCAFINRQGFISKASPPVTWTAAGAKQVALSAIPTGPSNIVARLILFTPVITAPATTGSFYSLPTGTTQLATPTVMLIPDNTTLTATLDFTDAILIASFQANYLFTQRTLGECSSAHNYNSRLGYVGERNAVQNFVNTQFDGGFASTAPVLGSQTVAPTSLLDDGGPYAAWAGASVSIPSGVGNLSNYLQITGFGFALPPAATITGITISMRKSLGSGLSSALDNSVLILRGGFGVGVDHANACSGPSWVHAIPVGVSTYGSAVDAWGAGLAAFDVNAANFGVEIQAQDNGGLVGATCGVADVSMTINFFTPGAATRSPLGWAAGGSFAGGDSALATGQIVDWGDAFAITGDGATAKRGEINQSAFEDFLLTPIIARNTSYNVRARLARNNTLAQGTLHINIKSASLGITSVGLAITAAQLTTTYVEFSALLTGAFTSPPTDLLLQVFADGTPTNNGTFLVDSIEVYPVTIPFNYSTAWFSHAFNPESFDNTTSQVQVRPNDGQQLHTGFPLRNSYYLAKDHYLCYVTDDGVNEPASWQVTEVSSTIGICGPNAVDYTEEFAVFAERSGLYICWGSDPVKITQEIQYDATKTGKIAWDSINWQYDHTIWVRIDKVNKQILIGAPVYGATTPNFVFVLDYQFLSSPQEIADTPLVTYSSYTGKMIAHGKARKWSVWTIAANAMTFAERSDGTAQPFFGNGVANGKIYQQADATSQPSDDGAAINSFWTSYYTPSSMEEQMTKMSSKRKLLGYLTLRAVGNGSLLVSVQAANRITNLRDFTLSTSPIGDQGRGLNLHGERFSISVGTDAVGSWFQLEKLTPFMRKDASIPVRGMNV